MGRKILPSDFDAKTTAAKNSNNNNNDNNDKTKTKTTTTSTTITTTTSATKTRTTMNEIKPDWHKKMKKTKPKNALKLTKLGHKINHRQHQGQQMNRSEPTLDHQLKIVHCSSESIDALKLLQDIKSR